MDTAQLQDLVAVEEGGVVRSTVLGTEHLWSQLVCVDRNASFGPVADPASDALLTVVAGEAVFLVDKRRRRLGQWGCVVVPAGTQLAITNASADPLVVLMVVAPPPADGT